MNSSKPNFFRRASADDLLLHRVGEKLIFSSFLTLSILSMVLITTALFAQNEIDAMGRIRLFLIELGMFSISCLIILLVVRSFYQRTLVAVHQQLTLRRKSNEDAAHELATPVSILKSRLQVMERQLADDDNLKENVVELVDATNRLVLLVDNIRALARAENCEFFAELSIIKLDRVVNAVISNFREAADRANIDVRLDSIESVTMVADAEGIERILANLISNGIKYGTAGGAVIVSLTQDRDSVNLRVSDDGCGIPQESIRHVFNRFYRVDKSSSREAGGSGLGLSITKAIVEAHSGSIKVESVEGKGSTFSVSLPKNPQAHPFAMLQKK